MMKFRHLLLSTAILILTTPAQAQSWYGGISGSAAWLNDADNSGAGSAFSVESQFDPGFAFSGHVGTTLATNRQVRLEAELSYQQNDVDRLVITNDAGLGAALGVGSLNGLGANASGDVSAWAAMANAYYDFRSSTPWIPYFGAGLGMAQVSADVSVSGTKIVDDDDTVFAYQLMAGLGYQVSPTMVLFGGYKYFGTGDPELNDEAGGQFDSEFSSHNVQLGLRLAF